MRTWKVVFALLVTAALMSVLFLSTLAAEDQPLTPVEPVAPANTDLAVESLILVPANPSPRQGMTLTAVVRNVGTNAVTGRRIYLYVNPTERPPISTTKATKEFVAGLTWPAGDSMEVTYADFSLNVVGCDNVVYAWVDPLDRIAESDETNNLKELKFCVNYPGNVTTGPDSYENDDVCDQASAIPTDTTAQIRNFSSPTDVDWIKFQATKGMTYTITAAGTGVDAYPNLEIWESCNMPPPGAFGTTARLDLVAPDSATYYIRVNNDQAVGDPATTSYELSVKAANSGGGLGVQPTVAAMQPNQGTNDRNTNVTITGVNLLSPSLAELCPYTNGQCNTNACNQLLDLSWSSENQTLFTIVQANTFAPGQYCVAVTNGNGRTGYLPNAFTVEPGEPDPRQVLPAASYSDLPTDIVLFGYNFFPGLALELNNTPLDNVVIASRTKARATVPAGLAPGIYALSASYAGGSAATLPNAFTVLLPTEDLFAQAQELWIDPVAPRAGTAAKLGMVVHRQDGTQSLTNVLVRFAANGSLIGDAVVPLLAPNSQSSTEWLEWTPLQEGSYQIIARIDPNNQIQEASESNNVVTRTITVLPPAADTLAPRVDSLTIGDGRATVTSTQIYLNASATDYPVDNPSGVASLRYIEFEYNAGNRLWLPIQDSDWVPYAQAQSNYRWTLSPVGGNHFIQAWARDHAGNVSTYPYQASVDYVPPTDRVGRDQTRIYRRTVAAGDRIEVTVRPQSGDPDLFIWPPNWQDGAPPWVSNLTGPAVDTMVIPSAPVSGTYQIEVYGYARSDYEIEIRINGAPTRSGFERAIGGIADNKVIPTAPLVDPNSEPPRNLPQVVPPPMYQIFLPATIR